MAQADPFPPVTNVRIEAAANSGVIPSRAAGLRANQFGRLRRQFGEKAQVGEYLLHSLRGFGGNAMRRCAELLVNGLSAVAPLFAFLLLLKAFPGALATARQQHTATLLPSGKVLVAGGTVNSGALACVEVYDRATFAWSAAG